MDIGQEVLEARKNLMLKALKEQEPVEQPEQVKTKAKIIVKLLPGGLEATLLLQPTSPDTIPPSKEELLQALYDRKIAHGINMPLIEDLCVKPVYYHVFVIARGIAPQTGRDGYLTYLVSNTADRSPVIGEDGVADYKNINFFRVAYKGQPLCEIHPPEKGEDGVNVHGEALEGKMGDAPFDPAGQNTVYSKDGTLLLAGIDGHVTVQYGKINVVEVLTVETGVNNTTGNINFVGDVVVGGDIASGFSVKSSGSIIVNGNVEGAILHAGADIDIQSSVLGMGRGEMSAGGNIKCKYIQNCSIRASGGVYADSILFSNVKCDGDLVLGGKKGALIGGVVDVGGKIVARTIGSPLNAPTTLNMVPLDERVKQNIKETGEKLHALNKEIQQI